MTEETRPDLRDLFAGIGIAVGAIVTIIGVCLALGWLEQKPEDGNGPSGPLVSGIWTFVVAGLAYARWLLLRDDPNAAGIGNTIVVIGVAILAYPFFTLGFESALIGLIGNFLIGVALIMTGFRAAQTSALAAALLLSPVLWLGYASYLVLDAMTGSCSP